MWNKETLKKRFLEAGLKLEFPTQREGRSLRDNEDVFALTIGRKVKGNIREEYFRMWPGADTNLVEVTNIDFKRKQLVLVVKEESREFWNSTMHGVWISPKDLKLPKAELEKLIMSKYHVNLGDLRFSKKGMIEIRRTTPASRRHILMGLDERQLFIATLPRRCTTVAEAHASLKTSTVTFFEGRAPGRTERQGEWFLVNPLPEELFEIERFLKKSLGVIHRNASLHQLTQTRGGKPHIVDEAVCIPGRLLEHGFPVRAQEVFIRGKLRHPDHKTKSFSSWRKVIRNNEPGNASGIRFID